MNDESCSRSTTSLSQLGDCGYQVILNGKILGTVFLQGPSTIKEIAAALETNRLGLDRAEQVFPCSSVMVFQDDKLISVERLPGAQTIACGKRIDLNSASGKDLESVPGIGPGLAKRIVEYRNTFGSFNSAMELAKVKGIGPKKSHEFQLYLK